MKVIDANTGEFVDLPDSSNIGLIGSIPDLSTDAFGRLRVSDTGLRVDSTFTYDKQPLLFDEVNSGAGLATFDSNLRSVYLSTGGVNSANSSTIRLHYHVPYTPGNSQFIAITGNLNPDGITNWTNLRAEIGYGNTLNGVGFRYDSNGCQVFLRSSISGSVADLVLVSQANWNVNTMSDTDWSKSQIFLIDFQSLAVGRIRFYLDRDGDATLVHEINNDNVRVGPYWQLASLTPYWYVGNTGTAQSTGRVLATCCTVKSEGGPSLQNLSGFSFSTSNLASPKTASSTLVPILSIQLQTTVSGIPNRELVMLEDISVMGTNPFCWQLVRNPTLSGANFSSIDSNSFCNRDVSATTISGGTTILTGFQGSSSGGRSSSQHSITGKVPLSVNSNGAIGDILTIAAIRVGSQDSAVSAALNWQEIR